MRTAIEYLQTLYQPEALIVYGSYADGSYTSASDFDALVICQNPKCRHDTTRVLNVPMDVFLYTPEEVRGAIDPVEFLQIHDGIIVFDKNGMAKHLIKTVQEYVKTIPYKSYDELNESMKWCEKMFARAERSRLDGYFRWHELLVASLEIYCDIKQKYYFGPKKTIQMMEKTDVESFLLYTHALQRFEIKLLRNWVMHLRKMFDRVAKEHLKWYVTR